MELRFRTDPNEPGTEKLTVAAPMTAWLEAEYKPLPHLDPGPLDFEAEGLPMSSPAAFVSYIRITSDFFSVAYIGRPASIFSRLREGVAPLIGVFDRS